MQEIVANGDVRLSEKEEPGALARRLAWELQDEDVLKDAWQAFATYDALGGAARKTFEKLQNWILVLGIVATAVALVKSALDIDPKSSYWWVDDVLHWAVVVLPILVAVLIGITYRLAAGNRWVLLRGAAETIKREIYRYRTGAGDYRRVAGASPTPRECLGVRLESIRMKLLQTEASGAELTPYAGPLPPDMYGASRDDDGLSPLDANQYLKLRVGDQLRYYHPKVANLARTRRRFQLAVLAAGGAGAIVAAAGQEIWVGLTTAIAAAAVAYLHSRQVENTLVAYNQAAGKLEALRTKWLALTDKQRKDPATFEALVNDGETILATELGGWVLQMTEALEELRSSQLEEARKDGIADPDASKPPADGGDGATQQPESDAEPEPEPEPEPRVSERP